MAELSGQERRRISRGWGSAGIGVGLLCAGIAALPALGGRVRAAIDNVVLYATTGSEASLPIVLTATDAASLGVAVADANLIGCGVHIDVSGSISANISLSPRCPDPKNLGIRVRGPATLYGSVSVKCQGADCAWASFEGLRVVSDDDAFDVSFDGKMAVIDSEGEVDGQYSNVLTAHGDSRLLAMGVRGRSLSSLSAPPLAFIERSRAIVAGEGTFESGSADRDAVLHVAGTGTGTSVALLGHTLRCGAPNQFAVDLEPHNGGFAQLYWAGGLATCPVDLLLGTGEDASIHVFGTGKRLQLPFPIPAWVKGTEYPEVNLVE